ncbi:MAG TPA: hypothetical protein VL475_16390 [Planctomycetaceae bacterium]|nr:hypothetical protein [Planctomycetaceae bacterium]
MRPSRCFAYAVPLLLAGRLLAHEPESLPVASPETSRLEPVPGDATDASVNHLLKSAERLEAAGLKDEAQKLRQEARERALRDNAIARKESELECLVEEIEQLRNLTGQSRAVMIRVVALEFSRAALGDEAREFDEILGLDSDSRRHKEESGADQVEGDRPKATAPVSEEKGIRPIAFSANRQKAFGLVDEHPLSNTLVQELLQKKLISVLAEPTLVTVSGRPAAFLSGGQFPIKVPQPGGRVDVQMVPFGVQLEARPTVLAGELIRVQTKFSFRERDFSHTTVMGGERIPGLSTRSVNTEVELRSGQTAVLGFLSAGPGPASPAPAGSVEQVARNSPAGTPGEKSADVAPAKTAATRELVVLITAELMSAPRTLPVLQPIPAEADLDADEIRSGILPSFVPDDLRYFPASPVPRKGTLR